MNYSPATSFDQPLSDLRCIGELIGREKLLIELRERLRTHRLVTMVGPGGIGKTRLAWELSKREQQDTLTPRTVVFVSLEWVTENSEGGPLDALVSALRLTPGDSAGVRASIAKRLNEPLMLLILDNCETARSAVAGLVGFFLESCPNLTVLATSQHQLGLTGLELVYEVPPLSVPSDSVGTLQVLADCEGYQLFVTRAQMASGAWSAENNGEPFLRRILQLTEGIPLAIEIIAAWAPIMSLPQICNELEATAFAPVTRLDEYSHLSPERHTSMMRCLEWSFTHLAKTSPEYAEGFSKIGVFAGRFTEESVAHVCEVRAPRDLLAHLVKTSFVNTCAGTDPRRYSMLRFTRAFSQHKAREAGIETDLVARHADYFANLVRPKEHCEVEPISLIYREHDWPDLAIAATYAYKSGNYPAVWHISRALGVFLQQYGLWSERERLTRLAVRAASDANYWSALERSLIDLGIVLEAQGLWFEAAEAYRRSLYFANRNATRNPQHQAMALQRLGAVLTTMGDAEGADRARQKLEEVSQSLEEPRALAISLDRLGGLLQRRGDLRTAEAKYRESYSIRESLGDDKGMAKSKENLGVLLTLQHEWQQAESHLRECLAFWRSRSDVRMQAILLHHLADLYRRQGSLPEALEHCERSLELREGDPKGRAVSLTLLAKIHRQQKLFDKALSALSESKELCRSIGNKAGETIALRGIGAIHIGQAHWNDALEVLEECRRLQETSQRRDVVGLGLTLESIGLLYARRGDWGQAEAAYSTSLAFSREAGRTVQAAGTLMVVAMMHAAQGKKAKALSALDEAISSLESERYGKALFDEAHKLRSRIDRKMRDGIAWTNWRDALFAQQTLFVRSQFSAERKKALWPQLAYGYETLVEQFLENGQQMEAGLALNELGSAYRHLAKFERSEGALRQALSIFEEIALQLGRAASWHKLGDLFADQMRWREAEDAYLESIKLKVECSDDDGEGISQDALASVLINVGRFSDAERAANRAVEIFLESGSAWQKWHALVRILWSKMEQDEFVEAQAVAARLVEGVQGNRELETMAHELHAMAERGEWDGVRARLVDVGITGPVETPRPAPLVDAGSKAPGALCSLRRRGQGWEVCFQNSGPFQLKDTVGVRYLATLLGTPGESIPCARLASLNGRAAVSSNVTAENTPVLTPEAKRAYRMKLDELKEQIAAAEGRGLVHEVIDLKEDAEEIDAALGAAHDKLGGDQSLTDDGNRVRNAVCNPIRRVMNALRDDPQTRAIGLYLIDQVDLGFNCAYPKDPEKGFRWVVGL